MTEAAKWNKTKFSKKLKANFTGYMFTVWPLVGWLLFGLFPMIMSVYYSFFQIRSYDMETAIFVGFGNYVELLTKVELFWKAWANTLIYAITVPLSIIIALGLAILVSNKLIKGSGFFRTLFYIPCICSTVAITLTWQWMYEPNYGVMNAMLGALNLPAVEWLATRNMFFTSVILMSCWGSGAGFLLYLAALSQVNPSLTEAARIDGAGKLSILKNVTIPAISPTTFYLLVTCLMGAFQTMTTQQVLSGGTDGPGYSALTLEYLLYRMAFEDTGYFGIGIACAMGWLISIVIMAITIFNFKVVNKKVSYDSI